MAGVIAKISAAGGARLRVVITPDNKYRVGVAALLGFFLLYALTNSLRWRQPALLSSSWIDDAIPLVPATVWLYASFVFLVIFAFILEQNTERLNRFLYAQTAVNVVSALVFILWPTTVPRPDIAGDGGGVSVAGLKLLYQVDAPVNCFPSLHVSTSLLPALMLWGSRSRLRFVFLLWALGISLSTITTKQHHFADVLGGGMVAGAMYWLFFLRASRLPVQAPNKGV